ncbi:MAG: T9SS type A sorting domain-containing protein [Bacteroidetes bacterium]|nr:T9SS type A sorting domain-containing protein [Bacteroidota bacterium]
MKKFLSFIVLLAICSTLSFAQNLGVKPSKIQLVKANEAKNIEQYLNTNAVSNSKATAFWSDNFATPANWKISTTAGTIGTWAIISDTGAASTAWKNFWGADYMGSPTVNQGVAYFDGIYQFVNNIAGAENSMITTASAINCSGKSAVNIKFFQNYYSFNADSTLIEISTDSVNFHTIMANPDVTANGNANTWINGWKEISISQWAANQAKVWIRFRFSAPAATSGGAQYGRGYGWMIDDVSLILPDDNKIQVDRVTLYDGYTQIPSGLGRPMYYDADFMNMGALTQTSVKLHGVEITTASESTSTDTTLLPGAQLIDWSTDNYIFTPPTTLGTYKVMAYISTANIPFLLAQDTFDIKVVCDTCKYSRDNNTYTSSRWAGATGTQSDPYTAANRFQVNQDRMAYGINCVVNLATKPGSKIKAVLYKYFGATATRTIVAQSANYYITSTDIPTTSPLVNPPSISLPFSTGYTMQKDSMYWVGIQVFGGTDTVRIATDNTGIPQYSQTSLYFDPTANTWYIWESGNVPAMMIRTVFNQNGPWNTGVNELSNTISLFSCMPNPANNSTQISYELKNNEKVSIFITDITGRTVKTLDQGTQTKGNYTVDLDLSNLTSGTYFYTLKTATSQATDKLIIVKR